MIENEDPDEKEHEIKKAEAEDGSDDLSAGDDAADAVFGAEKLGFVVLDMTVGTEEEGTFAGRAGPMGGGIDGEWLAADLGGNPSGLIRGDRSQH